MKKFWDWVTDEEGDRVLRLEGPIDADSFWGDEVTPQAFRDELEAGEGDVTVWINSEGGNVFAAAEIYTMLRDYPGTVTVKIASMAASAASVVAMAGDRVLMSPTAMLFLHDPSTIAIGNARDMEKAIETLNAVKESIINAYRAKTGLSRNRLSKIMENESFLHAEEALQLGFCDEILFGYGMPDPGKTKKEEAKEAADSGIEEQSKTKEQPADTVGDAYIYSRRLMRQSIMNYLGKIGVFDKTDDSATDEASDDDGETEDEASDNEQGTEEPETDDDSSPDGEPPGDILQDVSGVPDPPDNKMPVIGMDGRTKDGAMPYEILKNQLDFLK